MSLFVPDPQPDEYLPTHRLRALGSPPELFEPQIIASVVPDLGSGGFARGLWVQEGPLVWVSFWIQFGVDVAAGTGTYSISLPPEAPLLPSTAQRHALGQVALNDVSAPQRLVGAVINRVDTPFVQVQMRVPVGQTSSSHTLVSNNAPWTWDDNDYFAGTFTYLFDPAG